MHAIFQLSADLWHVKDYVIIIIIVIIIMSSVAYFILPTVTGYLSCWMMLAFDVVVNWRAPWKNQICSTTMKLKKLLLKPVTRQNISSCSVLDRLRCRCQPMDDRQQIEPQHGQDRAPLDWVATQPVPVPGRGSSSATGRRHCHSSRPGPAARGHHLCWFKSWPSRVRCQCDVLPFVTSASTSTSFTRHWVDSDACPCFCNV